MTQPCSIHIKHDGRSVALTLVACRVYLAGEFAGNVDLEIACDPALRSSLLDQMRLEDPAGQTSVEPIAWGEPENGVELTFHSDAVARLAAAPQTVTFLWDDERVATVEPVLADSVPIEQIHTPIDPLRMLGTPAMPNASGVVKLGGQRELLWLIPAVLLAAAGAALALAPDGLQLENVPYRTIIGPALIALGLVVGLVGGWMPYRQIWYDGTRRQLRVVSGRTLSAEAALADFEHPDLSEYAHVRLCERHYAAELGGEPGDDNEEWIVSLEGPIPYAFDDGRVHCRSDALELARFVSGRNARRLALEVARELGLPVLEATDW